MLSDDLAKRRVLPIWDVVEQGDAGTAAKHAEHSVDFPGEHGTLGEFLST